MASKSKKSQISPLVLELVEKMRSGDRPSLARLVSLIENRDEKLEDIVQSIFPDTGRAQILGITGPPGAGKSTFIDRLVAHYKSKSKRVAVVAVDPSSPFTGGAMLGDRIRMQDHSGDKNVYIRSLGTRGKHGGLSQATREVVMLLDAARFDVILVETAGVGQTELEILRLAQTIVVLLVPESGDSIQVMKAGLMEIADVFVVNKSDRPGADHIVRELHTMVGLSAEIGSTSTSHLRFKDWAIPTLKTEAVNGKGIAEVGVEIEKHQAFLDQNERRAVWRRQFLQNELLDILTERLQKKVQYGFESKQGATLMKELFSGKSSPYETAKLFNDLIS